jgi:hypothetical protein
VTASETSADTVHELWGDTLDDLLVVMTRRDLSGPYLQALAPTEVQALARITRGCHLACC